MKTDLVKFCCPSCSAALVDSGEEDFGYLICGSCGVAFAHVDGTVYFDRPTLAPKSGPELRAQLCSELFGDEQAYARFIASKHLRPQHDGYAAFEPFNESTRAMYAFMDEIRQCLPPGAPILDLWGRTAWSGASLAGYFPDNPVVMLWEGDRNVLGYKGYRYWLGRESRPSNLHIVFTDLEKPLPFPDRYFGLVHGLDTLHRYGPVPLVGECLRVARPAAPLVFAHIHLSNSEPEPFFERGCTQHHGRDYRRFMDVLERGQGRRSYLLSERSLFENRRRGPAEDDHDMAHYNALLYVAPVGVESSTVGPCAWPATRVDDDTRVVFNPLVGIDAVTGMADIDFAALGGQTASLLERHPVYEERLRRLLPDRLDDADRKLVYCLEQGASLADSRALLGLSQTEVAERLAALRDREVCTYAPVGDAVARMQRFYRTQRIDHALQKETGFLALWRQLDSREHRAPLFISTSQDVAYDWADVRSLVDTIRVRFHDAGLMPGQRILICAGQHPAYLLVIWAAWLSGLVVVPVCPRSHAPHLGPIVDLIRPALRFVETGVDLPAGAEAETVVFDPLGEAPPDQAGLLFSDWLDAAGSGEPPPCEDHETAVILLSSGTTGRPKAIVHSFANLLRGSIRLVEFYRLEPGTRMLSVGDFHSMSGLRNAAVLSLVNAHTLLLADGTAGHMALRFIDIARAHHPRLVFSSPALVDALARMEGRLEARDCASIDTWLCTGAPVSHALLDRLAAAWNIRFASYYGLTETGGFCAGTRLGQSYAEGELGEPVGAIFKLVDARGETIAGEGVGSLHVFSDQLMSAYLETPEPWSDGWLVTGDQVRRGADGSLVLLGRGQDEFSNAAGERVNLAYLETELGDKVDTVFALLHDGSRLTLVFECGPQDFEALQRSEALQALLRALSARGIATLSEMRLAHIATIPRTGNGKIQRPVLQRQLSHER